MVSALDGILAAHRTIQSDVGLPPHPPSRHDTHSIGHAAARQPRRSGSASDDVDSVVLAALHPHPHPPRPASRGRRAPHTGGGGEGSEVSGAVRSAVADRVGDFSRSLSPGQRQSVADAVVRARETLRRSHTLRTAPVWPLDASSVDGKRSAAGGGGGGAGGGGGGGVTRTDDGSGSEDEEDYADFSVGTR